VKIKVNTKGFGGREIQKTAVVYTDDPKNKKITLTIKGQVDQFATLTPSRVRMAGAAGDEVSSVVKIVPSEKYPFKILEVKTDKKDNVGLDLKEVKTDKGTEYLLTVKNLKNNAAQYSDSIIVKTDSTLRPELFISVYGNIIAKKPEAPKAR